MHVIEVLLSVIAVHFPPVNVWWLVQQAKAQDNMCASKLD